LSVNTIAFHVGVVGDLSGSAQIIITTHLGMVDDPGDLIRNNRDEVWRIAPMPSDATRRWRHSQRWWRWSQAWYRRSSRCDTFKMIANFGEQAMDRAFDRPVTILRSMDVAACQIRDKSKGLCINPSNELQVVLPLAAGFTEYIT
jgi:hypothetical protein